MKTLLIIDMQTAWLAKPSAPCFDSDGVVARIDHAASSVRAQGGQVIFVRHADTDAPIGSPGWQVLPELASANTDLTVDKLACDPFADTDLQAKLDACGARTVYICGFATEFCVDSAVRATASHRFDVVALGDAHTTSNRPHLSAQAIVGHHNWIWANMAAPAGSTVQVQSVEQAFPG
jgi:nicotinamidase-related amidase